MTTLITGASSGIGEEFARRFAARNSDLVLVSRSGAKLEHLAEELRRAHGIKVTVIPLDLSVPGSAAQLHETTEQLGLDIDMLINNAGFATHGDIADADPALIAAQIQLNCATLVDISTRYMPAMRDRRAGTIINIASTAGFQPVPHMAVYAASKAFVLTFTEALWDEARRYGVRVFAVCPGATDTPFFERVGEDAAFGKKRSPAQVVTRTMRELNGKKPSVVDGAINAVLARFITRVLPKRTLIGIAERSTR